MLLTMMLLLLFIKLYIYNTYVALFFFVEIQQIFYKYDSVYM